MKNMIGVRGALAIVTVAGIAMATGCGGHGAYTREGTSLAKQKMNVIKSATEWEMARQALFAGDLDKALKKVDVSLDINPGVAKSHVLRGRVLLEKGEIGQGMRSLETALAIDPDNIDANYYMGIASERLDQPEAAFEFYDRAAQLDEYNDQYAVAASEMLIDLNRLDEARAYLEKSASHDHSAGVRQTLGHIARLQGNLATAVTEFKASQLLAPDDAGILEDLTRAQFDTEDYGDAAYGFATLLTKSECSDRRDLKLAYARCLIKLDRPMEARKLFQDLTQGPAGQSDVEAWIGLGNISFTVGDFTTVRQAATRVVALAPRKKDGFVLWALLHRHNGNIEASIKSLQDAIARDDSDPMLYTMIALGQLELKNPAQAKAALDRALAMDPGNQSALAVEQMIKRDIASVSTDD